MRPAEKNDWVIWFVGLPASGKTSAARRLLALLEERGRPALFLDSDEVREAIRPSPGYRERERADFYATLAGLAALVARQGLIAVVAATAHRHAYRDEARRLAPRFLEVFVDVPLEACEARDPKGLYAAARAGRIDTLPGVGVPFEPPRRPDAVISGGRDEAGLTRLADRITAAPR